MLFPKTTIFIIFLLFFPQFFHGTVFAIDNPFTKQKTLQQILIRGSLLPTDPRVIALQNVLQQYNSPLTPYAATFVKAADKYGVDWRLLPAISGQESQFGTLMVEGTHNAYGWDQGYWQFTDWPESISYITKELKQRFIHPKEPHNIYLIAMQYAEDPNWPIGVRGFMEQINDEYRRVQILQL